MSMTWLANADKETFWAHHTWSAFAAAPESERTLAILPVFGFADHGLGLPLDIEETAGNAILHGAVAQAKAVLPLRVLPPVRFGLAPYPSCAFGIDAETAHDLIREIATSIKAAGFTKLVFFVTSPWHEEFIDAASRDTRVELGLQTFVINLSGLNLDFHPTSASRATLQTLGSHLLNTLPGSAPAADIHDAGFRPGCFRQPAPVTFAGTLDEAHVAGAATLASAAAHLARLLAEIDARAPLGSKAHRAPLAVPAATPATLAAATTLVWPQHRAWYLPALTRDQLAALPNKADALVLIPTGAIEQHGHHLPVGVDAIMGQAWINYALPKVPAGTAVYVAPPITYGKSNEHVGFPGTVYISAKTLRRLLLALAAQLRDLGFRKIGLINTHGGNSAVLVYTLREIQQTLGLRAGMLSSGHKPDLPRQEAEFGFHASEWETSAMLEVTEGLIDMGQATCEFPAHPDDPGELRPENAPAIFSWITKDISQSGVMGDATVATPEKGHRWMSEASTLLAKRIADIAAS